MTKHPEAVWRDIVGSEGVYEVSSHGRVRSIPRVVHRPGGSDLPVQGRILSLNGNSRGYLRAELWRNNRRKRHFVHRLVAVTFIGDDPGDGLDVCHNDGNHLNNQVSNLRWDTRSANMKDRIKHGTDWQASKTHCPYDHKLAAPNLVASEAKQGHRMCLACHRGRARVRYYNLPKSDLQTVSDRYYADLLSA